MALIIQDYYRIFLLGMSFITLVLYAAALSVDMTRSFRVHDEEIKDLLRGRAHRLLGVILWDTLIAISVSLQFGQRDIGLVVLNLFYVVGLVNFILAWVKVDLLRVKPIERNEVSEAERRELAARQRQSIDKALSRRGLRRPGRRRRQSSS